MRAKSGCHAYHVGSRVINEELIIFMPVYKTRNLPEWKRETAGFPTLSFSLSVWQKVSFRLRQMSSITCILDLVGKTCTVLFFWGYSSVTLTSAGTRKIENRNVQYVNQWSARLRLYVISSHTNVNGWANSISLLKIYRLTIQVWKSIVL